MHPDKKLLPEVGACTTCEHNTATLKSLFPEFAKQAICNNRKCFEKKCSVHFALAFASAIQENTPDALIFNGKPSEDRATIIQTVKGASGLPVYKRYDIRITKPPEIPVREEYMNEDKTDGEDMSQLDEQAFNEAMEEYEEENEEYNLLMQSGKVLKGLLVSDNDVRVVAFTQDKRA